MLLFLLSDRFREEPHRPPVGCVDATRQTDARALLGTALFVCFWCLLRLIARPAELSFDVALAVVCLALGIGAALRAARTLDSLLRISATDETDLRR